MSRSHRQRTKGDERRKYYAPSPQSVFLCRQCNKWTYTNKKAAKAVIERAHRGEAMGTYRCKVTGGIHLGHLSPQIRAGITTRLERYG